MNTKNRILKALRNAYTELGIEEEAEIGRPTTHQVGSDWTISSPLRLASVLKRNPREIAEEIKTELLKQFPENELTVDVAGPGFVNVSVSPVLQQRIVFEILESPDSWARPNVGDGQKVLLEYVSANPTGPLHVGNAWFGSYGDALARLLRRTNHDVHTEYYVNDAGNQILVLGESVLAKKYGRDLPERGYRGNYVSELAKQYNGPDDATAAGQFAAAKIIVVIRESLKQINIEYDNWFSEAQMVEAGAVDRVIAKLDEAGFVYRATASRNPGDGSIHSKAATEAESGEAVFFRSSDPSLGDSRDRVLVNAAGAHTYLAGDLAYHFNKLQERGYDHVINVLGADHAGQVDSLRAGLKVLGIDPNRMEIRLGQLISLSTGKMSKRSGNFIELETLVRETSPDSVRLLSLLNSVDQAQTVDLKALKESDDSNPAYYIQYAYARMNALRKKVGALGGVDATVERAVLDGPQERALMRALEDFPDVLVRAARDRSPHDVTRWAIETSRAFHSFYQRSRVIDADPAVRNSRMDLVNATQRALGSAIEVLGIEAPERMVQSRSARSLEGIDLSVGFQK